VKALGSVLAPHLRLEADPAASPACAPFPPSAPIFLVHGGDDTVIPAVESVILADSLRQKKVDVHFCSAV
jgi:acetyl esterase/lipase